MKSTKRTEKNESHDLYVKITKKAKKEQLNLAKSDQNLQIINSIRTLKLKQNPSLEHL